MKIVRFGGCWFDGLFSLLNLSGIFSSDSDSESLSFSSSDEEEEEEEEEEEDEEETHAPTRLTGLLLLLPFFIKVDSAKSARYTERRRKKQKESHIVSSPLYP